jgi:hypothetical protein
MTVRLTLDPPLAPVIEDESNASTTLAQPIVLNASSTPDRLDRLVDWLWDLDANADEDNDGDATNDGTWGSANTIQASWDRPGTFTVTLHVRDVDGRTAMVQHDVTVTDVTSPNAAVSSSATSNLWRTDTVSIQMPSFSCPAPPPPTTIWWTRVLGQSTVPLQDRTPQSWRPGPIPESTWCD